MYTSIDEIAPAIFRFSTFVPDVGPTGFRFNQFLVRDDEPFLFHTGMRQLYPLVSDAVSRVIGRSDLRWISFGHVEADECGATNLFLADAPHAEVIHGAIARVGRRRRLTVERQRWPCTVVSPTAARHDLPRHRPPPRVGELDERPAL